MLVGDVADDLLDDVLEGHDAGVAAVLVEDDGHLEPVLAQQREQRVEPEAVGDHDRLDHEVLDAGRGALVDGQRDRVLDVDGADHGVLVVEHREAGSAPVWRASSITALARSLPRPVVVRTRGVMISPAVRVPNSTLRSISSAVSASRVPWSAERWISEASSSELRAERSSSCGSMPSRRTNALAEPLSTRIGHLVTAVKPRMEALGGARGLHRLGEREVLGHHLAEEHRQDRAEGQPDGHRER